MDKKIKILLALLVIILSATSILSAEDYPSSFLGPGYREYLNGKIQDGYYVDTFAKLDVRLKTRIDKRNQIEDILNSSYRARPETNYSILSAEYEKMENQQGALDTIAKTGQEREKGAAANGEFYYIIHEDGKKEFFRDGLLWHIENELIIDQFGNSSRKDTYNIKYNEKRLMIGYESTSINAFGDRTYNSFECEYTADSVYYGANDTVANKLMSRYTMTEIDASGKKTVVSWTADGYVGKFLTGFREVVDSEVYGHSEVHRYDIIYGSGDPNKPTYYKEHGIKNGTEYDLERSNIQYTDLGEGLNPLMISWHEKYTDIDGNVTESDYKNEYSINGTSAILLSTINNYTRTDVGGTITQGWNKVLYTYDKNGVLESAIGYGEYSSTDVDGTTTTEATVTDTYEVIHGHAKVVKGEESLSIESLTGTTIQSKTQSFIYDQWGLHLLDATGATVGYTIGPGGDITYFYSRETYSIIWGEAKIVNVTSYSYSFNIYNENPLGLGELDFEDLENAILLQQYQNNADSYSISTKAFEYDDNGRLKSIVGNVDSYTQSITGSISHTNTQTNSSYGWADFNGEKYYVCISESVSITSDGSSISGGSWHSENPETYTLTFQACEYNGKDYWGISEGTIITTSYTISGSDQYNNVYTETVTKTYEYKYGQPWLTESSSVSETTDTKNTKEHTTTTSTTSYTYGEFTLDGHKYYGMLSYTFTSESKGTDKDGKDWSSTAETYIITYQECEYNGQKYWGIPEGTIITTNFTTTSDGKTSTVTNTYEIKFGQLMMMKSVIERDNKASTTINNYGWITFQEKEYYAIASQDYNLDGHELHIELGEYTLNDITYWGLKEGAVDGHSGWKVKVGSVSFQ
ncbi:MAG: hypothetical protein WCL25_00675 [bacterium]